jgi:hypothetical protein
LVVPWLAPFSVLAVVAVVVVAVAVVVVVVTAAMGESMQKGPA